MRNLFLITLILNGFTVSTQGWDVDYGVPGTYNNEDATSIELVGDSLYVFHSVSSYDSNSDLGVAKLSLNSGAIEWTKMLGDSSVHRFQNVNNHLDVNEEGTRFICASNYRVESGDSTLNFGELIMFDQHLDTLFTVLVGDSLNAYYVSQARFMADGGFIAVGSERLNVSGVYTSDMIIYRFDADGAELWNTTYNTSNNYYDSGYSILELSNGNILVGGNTRPNGSPLSNGTTPKLIRLNSEGHVLNESIVYLPPSANYYGSARINPISEQEVLIYLHKKNLNDRSDFRIIKMTHDLHPVFDSIYGANTFESSVYQVEPTEDGGFITAGQFNSIEANPFVRYGELVKYNCLGQEEWRRRFNAADTTATFNLNRFSDIKELPYLLGGGYVVCGSTDDNNSGKNFWTIRLAKDGFFNLDPANDIVPYVIELAPEETGVQDFSVFPNPTSDFLNVVIPDVFSAEELRSVKVVITDLQGREIQSIHPDEPNVTLTINVGNLSNASYMISLYQGDDKLATEKFIVAEEE